MCVRLRESVASIQAAALIAALNAVFTFLFALVSVALSRPFAPAHSVLSCDCRRRLHSHLLSRPPSLVRSRSPSCRAEPGGADLQVRCGEDRPRRLNKANLRACGANARNENEVEEPVGWWAVLRAMRAALLSGARCFSFPNLLSCKECDAAAGRRRLFPPPRSPICRPCPLRSPAPHSLLHSLVSVRVALRASVSATSSPSPFGLYFFLSCTHC